MRIKALQLHGFKSFVDRTTFGFDDGVTCVVGPNGCGKSNVVDAVRWVMGEQSPRRLRGKGMDDVIFAGSDSRPPIGMAEVSLTFENHDHTAPAPFTEFDEVQITRRLFRSGESEYEINKSACRMRDIQDFFRDSGIGAKGYTIVEQGRVAEIVSAKPDDRRQLIEEAAGISKYKARRREAEGKMASTEQNLVRVRDVLGEIKRQISSLERQAKKAAQYKRLQETLRVLELSLAADERNELLATVKSAQQILQSARDQVTGLEANLAERELAVEAKRIELTEAEKAVAKGAERLYALRSDIKNLEGQIELSRRERQGLADGNEGRREEIAALVAQRETAEAEAVQAADELRQIEAAVASHAATLSEAELHARTGTESLEALERERATANEAFVGVLTAIARIEDRMSSSSDRREELAQRLRSTDSDLEASQEQSVEADRAQDSLEEGLRNLLAERDRFQEQLVAAMNRQERGTEQAREASERLAGLRERGEARRARLASLKELTERLEDVGAGARHLLSQGDEARERFGMRGLVRDLLEVDREVERAVESVLAERGEAIVVERFDGAVGAIETLRRESAGRGAFIALPQGAPGLRGTVPLGQPLAARVRAREGYAGLADALLGDVYLVERLSDVAQHYGAHAIPATFVTRHGDVLTPDGVMRGGADVSDGASGLFGRVREVRELEQEVAGLETQTQQAEERARLAEREAAQATEELENLRNRHHTAALAVASHEKDLDRTRERVKTLGEARDGRRAERAELVSETESIEQEHERLGVQLEERRAERGQGQRALDALGLKIASGGREVTRLESRLAELRVAHQGRIESRNRVREGAERAKAASLETASWIERREREIAEADARREQLAAQIAEAEQALTGKLAEEDEARLGSERLRDGYEAQAGAVRASEEAVREVRAELFSQREQASGAELTARESELLLRHQDDAVRDKWGLDLASWEPPPLDDDGEAEPQSTPEIVVEGEVVEEATGASDEGADDLMTQGEVMSARREARRNAELARESLEVRKAELAKVRSKVQSLGDVNLGAIEEHEELAERFRFLGEQKADLEGTIDSLREAINRINRTSRKRFRETFEQVSKRFSENFPRLFGGGKASLMLTDADDVLEAGVDIMAQPPGKRLQNVNLLSGGEKTMTALALLMSVFQVRPSPFFLLDEVDAALDDANVGRFNQLIAELAMLSQFLVITHNKRTIEVGDRLYGVTMEQKGVSKLVAVELT